MAGVVGETGERGAQASVAGPSEADAAGFAGLAGSPLERHWSERQWRRSEARVGGELVGGEVAGAILAELGEDRRGADLAGAREAHQDPAVRHRGDVVTDAGRKLGDPRHQRREHGDEGSDHLALRLGLGRAGEALGRGAQAGEQLLGAAPAAVAVLGEEGGEAPRPEPGGALRRGIPLEEGERDRAVDLGEDRRGAGPEAFEQGAQLVGELDAGGDAGGDEVVAAAHQRAQGADRVRGGRERAEAVAVGAQEMGQIGEQVGVAAVVLGARAAVARARRLHGVGVDRDHRMAGGDERVDDQPRGPLERDRQLGGLPEPDQTPLERAQSVGVVPGLEAVGDRAGLAVDDADGVGRATPVQSHDESHSQILPVGVTLAPVGRIRGKLIVRRSGPSSLAHQPVARRVLPAPAARQVSYGPFPGERAWPSRRGTGSGSLASIDPSLPARRVHQ